MAAWPVRMGDPCPRRLHDGVHRGPRRRARALVRARSRTTSRPSWRAAGFEGVELGDKQVSVYCTLPGEPERVIARLREASARRDVGRARDDRLRRRRATARGRAPRPRPAPRKARARIVRSGGGDAPRCYRFERQCATCGELRGRINVLPGHGVYIDTRELSCRCVSIPCRYCEQGRVRRPLSEHCDPERRAGRMPWFGYLVPCGGCQAAGRGPRVQMST